MSKKKSEKKPKKEDIKIVYIGLHNRANYNDYSFDKNVPQDVEADVAELLLKSENEFKRAEGGD